MACDRDKEDAPGPASDHPAAVLTPTRSYAAAGLGNLGLFPGEIRNIVSKHVFLDGNPVWLSTDGFAQHPLTLVSRQIRVESIDAFYKYSTFVLSADASPCKAMNIFFNRTPPQQIVHVADMVFNMTASSEDVSVWSKFFSSISSERCGLVTRVEVYADTDSDHLKLPHDFIQSCKFEVEFRGPLANIHWCRTWLNFGRLILVDGLSIPKDYDEDGSDAHDEIGAEYESVAADEDVIEGKSATEGRTDAEANGVGQRSLIEKTQHSLNWHIEQYEKVNPATHLQFRDYEASQDMQSFLMFLNDPLHAPYTSASAVRLRRNSTSWYLTKR